MAKWKTHDKGYDISLSVSVCVCVCLCIEIIWVAMLIVRIVRVCTRARICVCV